MIEKLFPYQAEDAKILASKNHHALLHEPGVGKTYIALAAAKLAGVKKIGVFCPKSMIGTWHFELRQWGFDGYATNYQQLITKNFSVPPVDLLIADEAHYLKDWQAKRTKKFYLELAKHTPKTWFLTGTPNPRSNADLYLLFSFIQPGKHGSYDDFCEQYCYFKSGKVRGRHIETPYGYRNTEKINTILKEIGIRRTKAEVLPELPDILCTDRILPTSSKLIAECLDISESTVRNAIDGDGKIPKHLASIVRAVGLSKVPDCIETVENLNAPVLIFALHTDVIDGIVKGLDRLKVTKIDGSVSADERTKRVAQFQAGHLDVLVLQTEAAGTGITLTRATHIIHCERPWSAAAYEQANGRAHRIGQKNGLTVYNLVAPKTTDELVGRILAAKERGTTATLL